MGYNTVVVVMNDALSGIASDPLFGQSLQAASRAYSPTPRNAFDRTIAAVNGNSVYVNAAQIISQEHADYPQVVVVFGNAGWSLSGDGQVPAKALEAMSDALKRRGYRISAPKANKPEAA